MPSFRLAVDKNCDKRCFRKRFQAAFAQTLLPATPLPGISYSRIFHDANFSLQTIPETPISVIFVHPDAKTWHRRLGNARNDAQTPARAHHSPKPEGGGALRPRCRTATASSARRSMRAKKAASEEAARPGSVCRITAIPPSCPWQAGCRRRRRRTRTGAACRQP